jgi:hypothetical protein
MKRRRESVKRIIGRIGRMVMKGTTFYGVVYTFALTLGNELVAVRLVLCLDDDGDAFGSWKIHLSFDLTKDKRLSTVGENGEPY